jgi:hypothetical protein
MRTHAVLRHRNPYGLAFPLAELIHVRAWALQRGLSLSVMLDQVIDGAEFDELLVIRRHGPGPSALTIWRTAGSVIAQAVGDQPRAFTGIEPALAHYLGLLVPPPRRGLLTPPRRGLLTPPRRGLLTPPRRGLLTPPPWVTRALKRLALAAERHGLHV